MGAPANAGHTPTAMEIVIVACLLAILCSFLWALYLLARAIYIESACFNICRNAPKLINEKITVWQNLFYDAKEKIPVHKIDVEL